MWGAPLQPPPAAPPRPVLTRAPPGADGNDPFVHLQYEADVEMDPDERSVDDVLPCLVPPALPPGSGGPRPREPRAHSWFRTVAPLPSIEENPALHRAVIAYASDYTLLGTSALPHGLSWMRGELVGASLDHALWFHREARADEWLLYATDAPWSGGGRGFNRGRIFNQQGELVASVAQEGMMRRRKRSS